jgi:hypothetical protein
VPCTSRAVEVDGKLDASIRNVSNAIEGEPMAVNRPPWPVELAQPAPGGALAAQGHADALPSPAQKTSPAG